MINYNSFIVTHLPFSINAIIQIHSYVTRNGVSSGGLVWFMVFNATFNNISVISWRSVLLVEEIGVPGENYRPVAGY
jgi:hypothetical protein